MSVLNDVREEYLTLETAEKRYGVVIDKGEIKWEETQRLRQKMKEERLFVQVSALEYELVNGRRIVEMGSETAKRIGVSDGDLFECVNPHGAPLRGWARICPDLDGSVCRIGRIGLKLLKLRPGDKAELRRLRGV
jgi:hypothetical protein